MSVTSSPIVPAKTDNGSWQSKLPSPLTTTIIAGLVAALGTIANSYLQSRGTLQLESLKEQHELILKMISVVDLNQANLNQAKENLRFLAESGLVTDPEQAKKILDAKANPVLLRPSAGALLSGPDGTRCGANLAGIMQSGFCVFK